MRKEQSTPLTGIKRGILVQFSMRNIKTGIDHAADYPPDPRVPGVVERT